MRFIDLDSYDGKEWTLRDIYDDWKTNSADDPDNYGDHFLPYMCNVIMDTINGRNDLDIVGLTHKEINNITLKLLKIVREA